MRLLEKHKVNPCALKPVHKCNSCQWSFRPITFNDKRLNVIGPKDQKPSSPTAEDSATAPNRCSGSFGWRRRSARSAERCRLEVVLGHRQRIKVLPTVIMFQVIDNANTIYYRTCRHFAVTILIFLLLYGCSYIFSLYNHECRTPVQGV
jgi:hypothetical protein